MFDVIKIREDFPMIKNNQNLIYFDSSATSFKPQCVIDEIVNYYENTNTNIHRGDYDLSFLVSKQYDETRNTIKQFINANDSREIVFTSGDTQSLNTIAYSYGLNNLKKGDVVLTSEVEHASNILPWFNVTKKTNSKIKYIELNEDASFNIDNYIKCFEKYNVKIVSLTYVSNVMGYIYPIKEICKIAHEHGAIVSIDAAQAIPHLKVDVKDLDVDFLSFSSHKMCGPAGIGVLYGKLNLLDNMEPLLYGGGSNARFDNCGNIILKKTPEKFEAGTPNIEGVLGLNKAAQYLMNVGMNEIDNYCKDLSEYFMNELSKLDNVEIYNKDARSGIITFNVKGIFAQDAASYFNSKGVAVRSGNHCAKLLVNIIGTSDTIRASMYFYNTKQEIDNFIEIIRETTIEKCVDSVL